MSDWMDDFEPLEDEARGGWQADMEPVVGGAPPPAPSPTEPPPQGQVDIGPIRVLSGDEAAEPMPGEQTGPRVDLQNLSDPAQVAQQGAPQPKPITRDASWEDIVENTALGARQGASLGFADEIGAGFDWVSSRIAPGPPRAASPELGAPEKGPPTWDELLQAQRQRYHQAQEETPAAFTAGDVAGSVGAGLLVPGGQVRGLNAAGKVGRAAIEGVGIGALEGAGRSEADTTREWLRDAAMGATVGGVAGGALSGVGQGVAAGARGLRNQYRKLPKMTIGGASDEALQAADDFLQPGEAGQRVRQQALAGEEGFDDATREIVEDLSLSEEANAVVQHYGTVGMKRGPVAKSMAAEGVEPSVPTAARETVQRPVQGFSRRIADESGPGADPIFNPSPARSAETMPGEEAMASFTREPGATDDMFTSPRFREQAEQRAAEEMLPWQRASAEAVEGVREIAQRLRQGGGERLPAGATAARRAMEDIATFGDVLDDPVDQFMRLDELKRRIGKNIQSADRGVNRDPAAVEALKEAYEDLRVLLEREDIWGEGAANLQKRVNATWHPWIRGRNYFRRKFLQETSKPSPVDPYDTLPEGNPTAIQETLSRAGTPTADVRFRELRRGIQENANLQRELSDAYEADDAAMDYVQRSQQSSERLLGNLDRIEAEQTQARRLKELEQAGGGYSLFGLPVVPAPGKMARTVAQGERAEARGMPRALTHGDATTGVLTGAAGYAAGADPETAAAMGAGGIGARKAGRGLAPALPALRRAASGLTASTTVQEQEPQQQRPNQGGRMGEELQRVIEEEPELLGDYLQPLQQAGGGDRVGLAAAAYALAHQDERFRSQVLPEITKRARGEQ